MRICMSNNSNNLIPTLLYTKYKVKILSLLITIIICDNRLQLKKNIKVIKQCERRIYLHPTFFFKNTTSRKNLKFYYSVIIPIISIFHSFNQVFLKKGINSRSRFFKRNYFVNSPYAFTLDYLQKFIQKLLTNITRFLSLSPVKSYYSCLFLISF